MNPPDKTVKTTVYPKGTVASLRTNLSKLLRELSMAHSRAGAAAAERDEARAEVAKLKAHVEELESLILLAASAVVAR